MPIRFATAIFIALIGFALRSQAAERNVIFIITDDESPTLGCYGDLAAKTPAIDAIAKDGVVFDRAFATTASCSASRSVVMSGLHNHRNGQFGHEHAYHKFTTFQDVVGLALPRVMQRAGYRTGHIGKYHVAPETVYHFETYLKGNGRNAVEMADKCQDFIIDRDDDRPFFLYFGTSDPHRGGGTDQTSESKFKPNLFGNKPNKGSFPGVDETFFDPNEVTVPPFLPDTTETREELAQYYQSCSRVDAGVARLVKILKEADLYDKTLIVFTSDHGMAFAGGKTTVYEGGLHVPMVVRDPYQPERGFKSQALISHIDITPTLLDFAGGLDQKANAPKKMQKVNQFWKENEAAAVSNRNGGKPFNSYHGKSWLGCLSDPDQTHHDVIMASHTFHEIQMYYPMRVVRDDKYKLIWNIAHPLPYPFASDLWAASSWQAQLAKGNDAPYGQMTVGSYVQRPEFELFDMQTDPNESTNLADSPGHADVLETYKKKLKELQKQYQDPWIMKWDYE
ncbi:sulfatase [Stieleria sp. JC731]|uniref:sulfatase family protein n=1 Tax=Pirellulaceae TaxID=2691357 RepID=UPI001E50D8E9|nr:sulfatase [Stieleria sp. JC731]MCC9602719.1 sulfatase [Stieleria sp. JC731]